MGRYIVKRLLQMVPVFFIVTIMAFLLMYLSPGDPVTSMLAAGGAAVDPDVVESMRHELGLDRPAWEQYFSWLGGIFTGDLGTSITSNRPVTTEIWSRMPATLYLAVMTCVLTLVISVPLGFVAAVKRNRAWDNIIRVISFVGASFPGFLMALVLIYIFALNLRILPTLGTMTPAGQVLPVATLVICESSVLVRQVRTIVLSELNEGYVTAEKLRGIKQTATLFKSVLRSIFPTVLILVGMMFGKLLGGSAIIETVFNWPGVGNYAVAQVFSRNYPVVQGYALVMAVLFMLVNLAVDIAQAFLDPRAKANLGLAKEVSRRGERQDA
jgi:peptide/nickel transport system permease protein